MPLWSFLSVANYYYVEKLAFRQLQYMLAVVYLFRKTLGMGDRALVHSVACCDSYWCMILHPWEAESAFCALCAISSLPRVLLSCYFTGVTCSRGIGAPFMQAWNGVLGHEMPQTRPSGVDIMLKMHVCSTACA